VTVASEPGKGSVFTVRLPAGTHIAPRTVLTNRDAVAPVGPQLLIVSSCARSRMGADCCCGVYVGSGSKQRRQLNRRVQL
jgi:hypothetical protein